MKINMFTILFISSVVVTISAFLFCDTEERFCPEFGKNTNHTKCEGQLDVYTNRSFPLSPDITSLDLSGTTFKTIPVDKENFSFSCILENLQFFNISSTQISDLRNMICLVPEVKVLDLSRNSITIIRRNSFSRMAMMTNLYLTSNGITIIESNAFSDLKNLTSLDLSDNDILGIETGTLAGLTSLNYINLGNNKISFLMVGAFSGLSSIEFIDLSNNIISYLDKLAFAGAEGLKHLNLRENQMKHTSFEFIGVFRKLDSLDLSKNKFQGLEQWSFVNLNVSKIVLTHTPALTFVMENAFVSCPFLNTVDFSQNHHLYYIHGRAFQNVSLDQIDFTNSAIEYLYLETIKNVTLLTLNNTNIKCDCLNENILSSKFQTVGLQPANCPLSTIVPDEDKNHSCIPRIISKIANVYSLSVGEKQTIECFAVGKPCPYIQWVKETWNGSQMIYETVTDSHKLEIHVTAITQSGRYGCVVNTTDQHVTKFFTLDIKGIDIGVFVIARASTSIVISWNKTHHELRHVILHRAYETTINYHVHKLKDYWKVFKISDLQPQTPYEICIGSALDINDRSCIKSSTTLRDITAGIHTDVGVVIVLSTAALLFGACFVATFCKCIKKITDDRGVCMVNSLSREHFGDAKEAILTYENQFTDFDIMEDEGKTEF